MSSMVVMASKVVNVSLKLLCINRHLRLKAKKFLTSIIYDCLLEKKLVVYRVVKFRSDLHFHILFSR